MAVLLIFVAVAAVLPLLATSNPRDSLPMCPLSGKVKAGPAKPTRVEDGQTPVKKTVESTDQLPPEGSHEDTVEPSALGDPFEIVGGKSEAELAESAPVETPKSDTDKPEDLYMKGAFNKKRDAWILLNGKKTSS
jgi:hypothetical protein